jgi:hypothetical protein
MNDKSTELLQVTLFEIMTDGETPYAGMTNLEVQQQVSEGYRLPQPQDCPDDIYEIMKGVNHFIHFRIFHTC